MHVETEFRVFKYFWLLLIGQTKKNYFKHTKRAWYCVSFYVHMQTNNVIQTSRKMSKNERSYVARIEKTWNIFTMPLDSYVIKIKFRYWAWRARFFLDQNVEAYFGKWKCLISSFLAIKATLIYCPDLHLLTPAVSDSVIKISEPTIQRKTISRTKDPVWLISSLMIRDKYLHLSFQEHLTQLFRKVICFIQKKKQWNFYDRVCQNFG